MNAAVVTTLLGAGLETDKATTAAAVRAKANAVDCVNADDRPLPPGVLRMLHVVFNANLRHLSERSKITINVTCMQPTELGFISSGMSDILDRLTMRLPTTLASMDLSTITLQETGL